jgi:hypothetical protein
MERFGSDPREMAEKAKGMAENVQEKVKDTIKNVSAEVQGRVEAAKDYVEELRDKEPGEILDEFGTIVRDHPIATIASCLFLGYWAGRFFGSKS